MGDMGEAFNAMKEARRIRRRIFGIECPKCKELRPNAHASILLPQQQCKVDKYRDPRPHTTREERNAAYKAAGLDIAEEA